MKKNLRILGIATVIGAAAIVAAQQSASRPRLNGSGAPSGQAVASVTPTDNGWISSNEVTELMLGAFSTRQLYEIEVAQLSGHPERVQPIIHANCAAFLTLMTQEQRERQIKSWELDKYAPGSQAWAQVVKAPMLANHLLRVNAKARSAAAKAHDEVWAPVRKYTDEMNKRLFATKEWKAAKTKHEQNLVHYAFFQKHGTKTPMIDRKKAALARREKSMEAVRAVLNAEERREFDAIVARFERTIKAAAEGRRVLP